MKKIIYIIALLSAVATVGGCTKDITKLPQSAATIGTFFQSGKDINSALAGMYGSFLQEMTGSGTGNGNYFYWGEARSDNFNVGATATISVSEDLTNAISKTNTATDWAGLYRTIARANLNIANFPNVARHDNSVTPTITNNAMAQCYAMRAECYFYIIRNWGAAPVWTEPYTDPVVSGVKPRKNVQFIIDSVIIPDLTKAYSLIQHGQQSVVWNINEAAICGIMGDVYMWRAGAPVANIPGGAVGAPIGDATDYQNAIAWYKKLFLAHPPTSATTYGGTNPGAANLEPAATWKNIFVNPASSNEAIWSMNWDETVNSCACIPVSIQTSGNPLRVDGGNGGNTIDGGLYNNWPKNTNDIRVKQTFDPTVTGSAAGQYLLKYYNAATQAALTSQNAIVYNVYLVMYRLSDVYLSYAEALNQTGDQTNALKFLNYIHFRATGANYTASQYPDQASMQNAILQERQWELLGEGKRWYDLIRTGKVASVMSPILVGRGAPAFTDMNKVLWPISATAFNANNLLNQNASYF